MRLFSICEVCHKRKFLIKNRKIKSPVGNITSQKLMCGKCYEPIKKYFKGK